MKWLLFLMLFLSLQARGQTGSVSGYVTDEIKRPFANVRVQLESPPGNVIDSTKTDRFGNFLLKNIHTAIYSLRFTASKEYIVSLVHNIPITADSERRINNDMALNASPTSDTIYTTFIPGLLFPDRSGSLYIDDSSCVLTGRLHNKKNTGLRARIGIYKDGKLLKRVKTRKNGQYYLSLNEGKDLSMIITKKKRNYKAMYFYPVCAIKNIELIQGKPVIFNYTVPLNIHLWAVTPDY